LTHNKRGAALRGVRREGLVSPPHKLTNPIHSAQANITTPAQSMNKVTVVERELTEPGSGHSVPHQEGVDVSHEFVAHHAAQIRLEKSNQSIGNFRGARYGAGEYSHSMYTGWRARLAERMERLGHNKKSLSLAAGLSATAVYDILDRSKSPGIEALQKLGNVLGMSLAELVDGEVRPPMRVPVIGELANTDEWSAFGKNKRTPDIIDMPSATEDLVAIRVLGNGMAPRFQVGDVILATRIHGAYADNYIGTACVVKTEDEKTYIKVLTRGAQEGTYTLRSYDPTVEDIKNVKLLWFGPIVAIMPRA
jgi:hypothetical protein